MLRLVRNQKGVALLMAISVMSLLLYLAMEVMYETNVEYIVNSQNLNRLKAYYAAKAGMELSLLRIKMYTQIKKQLGPQAASIPFIEQIWQFPIMWPLPTTEDMGAATKDEFSKVAKASWLDANFSPTIDDESSKIDLNDLVSPSKPLRDASRKQILNIFEQKKEGDQAFQARYSSVRFDELVNNIADWMSGQSTSLNGGDKKAPYREYGTDDLPPNRGFRTLSELRLVAGMNDEFYSLLEPRITIYGLRGINPNTASKDVIMSLDPTITSQVADKAIERRNDPQKGGPFKDSKEGEVSDFQQFLESSGARLDPAFKDIPFVYGTIVAFRVSSIGEFARASRKITVITFNLDESATKLADRLKKEAATQGQTPTTTTTVPAQGPGANPNDKKDSKGPPRIVYWSEE